MAATHSISAASNDGRPSYLGQGTPTTMLAMAGGEYKFLVFQNPNYLITNQSVTQSKCHKQRLKVLTLIKMLYQNEHDDIFHGNLCCKVSVLNEITVVRVNLFILSPELYSFHFLLGKKIQSS